MCGIAGSIRLDGGPVDRTRLKAACQQLRHRGPDDSGVWIDESGTVGFAAVRLAVLDPTPAGHQPMTDPAGRFRLVYNGEVYNYRELRRELLAKGSTFRTETDTEVVLEACACWGPAAAARLEGMFALAFYDSLERRGFLARDPFGIKPLFYTCSDLGLSFASELDPLRRLALGFNDQIDREALSQHLTYGFIADPATIYAGARRLPPGHLVEFSPKAIASTRRFNSPLQGMQPFETSARSYSESFGQLRRLVADAVVRQRVSDVPIGAFLSGGLDSSIIVHHLAEAVGRPVQTFSVGYADQAFYDETRFARLVAKRYSTEHHELRLTHRDVLETIPAVLDHLGEPVGDSSIIPTSLVAHFARGRVTVALSGDGGDELFGGYWRYTAQDVRAAYDRLPTFLRRSLFEPLIRRLSSSRSGRVGNRVRQFRKLIRPLHCSQSSGTRRRSGTRQSSGTLEDALARHLAWSRILSPEAVDVLLRPERLEQVEAAKRALAERLTADLPQLGPLGRILAFDVQHQLPADMLQKVDLASMMHSLEVRVPLLDPAVARFALGLPAPWKVSRGIRKRILVDAYRGHLPDAILDRPKQGFEVPVGEYLRGPLADLFRDVVTRREIERTGVLSWAGVEQAVRDHLDRRADHADLLWALLSLCWWQRRTFGAG